MEFLLQGVYLTLNQQPNARQAKTACKGVAIKLLRDVEHHLMECLFSYMENVVLLEGNASAEPAIIVNAPKKLTN